MSRARGCIVLLAIVFILASWGLFSTPPIRALCNGLAISIPSVFMMAATVLVLGLRICHLRCRFCLHREL
jgi:hypothetical protein